MGVVREWRRWERVGVGRKESRGETVGVGKEGRGWERMGVGRKVSERVIVGREGGEWRGEGGSRERGG